MNRRHRVALLAAAALLLAACAVGAPPPDWQAQARQALDAAVAAYLEGNARVEAAETARARRAISASGRVDLLARAELMRCAARTASLEFEPCAAFEPLRADAPQAERAYADFLAGRLAPQDAGLLPPAQRAAAAAGNADAALDALRAIDEPLARLIAAGVVLQAGRARPETLQLAVDTASEQGWRRPLLAWLEAQLRLAEQAGAEGEAQRLRRRIAVVEGAAGRAGAAPPAQ
jgi:uncharacterized protein YecT (DUF1311 family)